MLTLPTLSSCDRHLRLGSDHTGVAISLHYLGRTHHDLGDLLERANEYHERALAIELKMVGLDNADVAVRYHLLCLVHQDLGNLDCEKGI